MKAETLTLIFIAIFTALFAVIGWFVARTISGMAKNIETLFKKHDDSEREFLEYKTESAKTYVTKEDCDKVEHQRIETEERIKNYRERFKNAHEAG